jgi:3-dehydroquinate synthase
MTFNTGPQNQIKVQSHHGNYLVTIHPEAYGDALFPSALVQHKQVLVVTHDELVQPYYAQLEQTLMNANVKTLHLITVPTGDANKTMKQAQRIWQCAMEYQLHRDAVFVALGGGMVGDLTGFSASCYLRGVACIQCPTTLLAQVDAAVGGKTAVNHPMGKNLIGTFHSPAAVLINPNTLDTLSDREFQSGLAEVIKYGLALDLEFFNWLELHASALRNDKEKCMQAIYHCCRLKAEIVSQDEFESNKRMLLNFGHTLGHAIEGVMQYQNILHGEAVAIGMVFATYLSCELNLLTYNVLRSLISILESIGLPICLPKQVSVDKLLDKMQQDKKFIQKMNWILLRSPGEGFVSDQMTLKQVKKYLEVWSNG